MKKSLLDEIDEYDRTQFKVLNDLVDRVSPTPQEAFAIGYVQGKFVRMYLELKQIMKDKYRPRDD